ncbi:MAG TPA: twin-arginine translocase TatA/TatE family subunit [Candidatus Eisenbacteria bacterium]
MFGLGGGELGILFLIVLLLFGPSALPKMARGLGEALREFRKAQREIRDEIQNEEKTSKPPDQKPVQ